MSLIFFFQFEYRSPYQFAIIIINVLKFAANYNYLSSQISRIIYSILVVLMDQQNTFFYPRSFQPETSNRLGKQFYKEKSIWEEITGQPEDHKLAKLMYKNSTILPPPTKTMQKKKKQFNDSFSQLKHKLRSIFIRMRSHNDSLIAKFKANPNDVNKMHLEPHQLSSYLENFEYQAIRKFNMLIKNSKSLLRDFMYKEAKQQLDDIQNWISEVQKMMKAKYQQKARKKQQLQHLISQYQQYSLLLQQSGMEQQIHEKDIVPYNVTQAIQFSLTQLRIEMSKITDKKQMPAAQQFENLLHKIGRDNGRDDYRNDYNV